MIRQPDTILEQVMIRGLEDIIQVSAVVSDARFNFGIEEGPELFTYVSDCYRTLVRESWAIVGDLEDSKVPLQIIPWEGDENYVAKRIVDEWKALGRSPSLGEICWFKLTKSGREQALLYFEKYK